MKVMIPFVLWRRSTGVSGSTTPRTCTSWNIGRADGRRESPFHIFHQFGRLIVPPYNPHPGLQLFPVSSFLGRHITSTSRDSKHSSDCVANFTDLPNTHQQWEDKVSIAAGERIADTKNPVHSHMCTMSPTSALRQLNKRIASGPDTLSSSFPIRSIAWIHPTMCCSRGESGLLLPTRPARYRANKPGGIPSGFVVVARQLRRVLAIAVRFPEAAKSQ